MSFATSFVIWTVAGALIGWLARRGEPQPAARSYPYGALGIVGGILGGLLWFSRFEVSPEIRPGSFYYLVEFLSFNLFSPSFGFISAFWALHIVHGVRGRR